MSRINWRQRVDTARFSIRSTMKGGGVSVARHPSEPRLPTARQRVPFHYRWHMYD